jgi:hypothetical protein
MGQAISKGVLAVLVASVLLQSSVALKGGGGRLGNFVQPSRNFVPHSRAVQSNVDDCVMCDEMDPNFVQPSRNFVHRSRAGQSWGDDCVMCDEMGDLDPMEETWSWKRREEKRRREEEKNKMELQEAKQSFLHPAGAWPDEEFPVMFRRLRTSTPPVHHGVRRREPVDLRGRAPRARPRTLSLHEKMHIIETTALTKKRCVAILKETKRMNVFKPGGGRWICKKDRRKPGKYFLRYKNPPYLGRPPEPVRDWLDKLFPIVF